ncbi:hypothetical protein GCM10020331_094850 [Ectobacillus funiculus]
MGYSKFNHSKIKGNAMKKSSTRTVRGTTSKTWIYNVKDIPVLKSQSLSDINERLGFNYSTIAPFN